jgi:hypothetical protein
MNTPPTISTNEALPRDVYGGGTSRRAQPSEEPSLALPALALLTRAARRDCEAFAELHDLRRCSAPATAAVWVPAVMPEKARPRLVRRTQDCSASSARSVSHTPASAAPKESRTLHDVT